MQASKVAIELIKKFEGFRGTAYKCPGGVWTLGYGETSGVGEGDMCTLAQAESWLKGRCRTISIWLTANVDSVYHFNQNQFDALVSFAYNLGNANVVKLTSDNTRTIDEIAEKMLLYTKANGAELPGLVKRRQAEHDLFTDKVSQLTEIVGSTIKCKQILAIPKVNYRVRDYPHGAIIGSTDGKSQYEIIGGSEDWYRTTVGWIHRDAFDVSIKF